MTLDEGRPGSSQANNDTDRGDHERRGQDELGSGRQGPLGVIAVTGQDQGRFHVKMIPFPQTKDLLSVLASADLPLLPERPGSASEAEVPVSSSRDRSQPARYRYAPEVSLCAASTQPKAVVRARRSMGRIESPTDSYGRSSLTAAPRSRKLPAFYRHMEDVTRFVDDRERSRRIRLPVIGDDLVV